jgi:hypothetical protein
MPPPHGTAAEAAAYSGGNSGRDTGSDYGQFDRAVSQVENNPPTSQPSGGDGLIDPGFHPALAAIQDQQLKDSLATLDDAYGRGEITETTYNEDGTFSYEQTEGIIESSKYQTANLKAYLDSDIPTDKQKVDALNRLSAIANSDLVGSKLKGVDEETGDFVLDNLDQAFANLENDPEYYEYVSQINKVPDQTFLKDLQENPVGTVVKSGGLMGTMIKGVVDQYQNNKALELLGYTGKVIREGGEGGLLSSEDYLLGNVETGADVNEAITRLPSLIGGNELPPSVFDKYFSNISQAGDNIMNQYNLAKAKTNNFITTPLTNASYGIFEEAKLKGLI